MWLIYYIIPGIPPPPIGGIGEGLSSLMSTNAHSVVNIIPATDAAFSRATLVTFLGSIIPSFNISTYLPSFALYPKFLSPSRTFDTTTDPSPPEFSTIVLKGVSIALFTIWIPVASSAFDDFNFSNSFFEFRRATPPPATIPSSIAALVA